MSEQLIPSVLTVPYRPARSLTALVVALGLAVFGLARCYVDSALWLDEALSVSIARLPLSELTGALRLDGSPPLYYVLLHLWMQVFGTGDLAVRLLSAVFSLAALPLAFAVGRRLRDATTGWCAVLLLAVSPFAVHYATETRMYALLVAEALLLALALLRARQQPTLGRLAPLPVLTSALLYTHYWSLFLLGALGLLLLSWCGRGAGASTDRRLTLAVAVGGVLFAPWLPTFLEQVRHTGTPWAQPPGVDAFLLTVREWAGGPTTSGELLTVLLLALAAVGLLGRARTDPDGRAVLALRLPVDRTALALLWITLGGLTLGLGAAMVGRSGYAFRYSSVVLAPGLLLAALGLAALPVRARALVATLVVLTGGAGVLHQQLDQPRTQAAQVAAVLRAQLRPGDLVVYCPDQLGPAVSRLLPPGTDQAVYPSFDRPERVDWRDYQVRNNAADPVSYAVTASRQTAGAVLLVWQGGYRTFGTQCQDLAAQLKRSRGFQQPLVRPDGAFAEQHHLDRFPAVPGS